MSHRITTKSSMKDVSAIKAALEKKGWSFSQKGNNFKINSGPMGGASIDAVTGSITGDTDYHDDDKLKMLNQTYLEVITLRDIENQGGEVLERSIEKDGSIRLVVRASMI